MSIYTDLYKIIINLESSEKGSKMKKRIKRMLKKNGYELEEENNSKYLMCD